MAPLYPPRPFLRGLPRAAAALTAAVLIGSLLPRTASAQIGSRASVQLRTYGGGDPGVGPEQEGEIAGLAERIFVWDDGDQALVARLFGRLDLEGRSRSHLDPVNLYWERSSDRWELRVGAQEVFWGVLESRPVVDIVNQIDVGGGPHPRKLGQPMVALQAFRGFGEVGIYVLPWFRERRFDGRSGSLWSGVPVAGDRAEYESDSRSRHVDWALRWAHGWGDWRLGVARFEGTGRDPRFERADDDTAPGEGAGTSSGAGVPVLVPRYGLVRQTVLDAQWTRGSWLWKVEGLRQSSGFDDHYAVGAGAELAVADYLSVFVEYLYDDRGVAGITSLDSDLFAGARLLTFDWTVAVRSFVDARHGNLVGSAEVSRRLGDGWIVGVDAGAFHGSALQEPPHALRSNDHLSLTVDYFF